MKHKYVMILSNPDLDWYADITVRCIQQFEPVQLRYCQLQIRRTMEQALTLRDTDPHHPLIDWHRTRP